MTGFTGESRNKDWHMHTFVQFAGLHLCKRGNGEHVIDGSI